MMKRSVALLHASGISIAPEQLFDLSPLNDVYAEAMTDVMAAPVLTGAPLGGQGWLQIGELGLALLLSACIGLEREIRQKNAGLRTHTLVGLGAALFMLVSKYGFTDVLEKNLIVLDPLPPQ